MPEWKTLVAGNEIKISGDGIADPSVTVTIGTTVYTSVAADMRDEAKDMIDKRAAGMTIEVEVEGHTIIGFRAI